MVSGMLLQFCGIRAKHALHEVRHDLLLHVRLLTACSCQQDAVAGDVAGIDARNTNLVSLNDYSCSYVAASGTYTAYLNNSDNSGLMCGPITNYS
jgi:hypothetical protein